MATKDKLVNLEDLKSVYDHGTGVKSELHDIRLGADGTTYASAGDAVRGQVGDLKSAVDKNLLDKKNIVNPDNWLNLSAITYGECYANGTITESSTKFYTDYIPVTEGNKMKGFRTRSPINAVYRRRICLYDSDKNVVSGGSDSSNNNNFTIPANVSYCRITFDANILDLKPVIVNDGTTPTTYSEYFDPYEIYTEDFLTPESEEAVQKITNKDLSTADLKNYYACAVPKGCPLRMTVGIPEIWYYANCLTPTGHINIKAGQEYATYSNRGKVFPNDTALNSVNGFAWNMFDDLLAPLDSETGAAGYGRARHIINENLQDCSVLVIGDSTVDFDTMTQKMLDYFVSKERTLTLLGTLGDGMSDNKNEGRAGWKATDYLTNKTYNGVVNPFYNPSTDTFDFSYYMTNQGYSVPDFVIIQLGINDLYNSGASAIKPTWEAIATMIDSILDYNNAIHIILNLPTAPNSDSSQHTLFLPAYQNRLIRYNEYAQTKAITLYGGTKVRVSYCHLILDPYTDIRDNVHPTVTGFEKMALEIINQINCWQNGV